MTEAVDVERVAANLDEIMRAAIANYPMGWTDERLPAGWSGTPIGRLPLLEIHPNCRMRRLNRLGLAVKAHLSGEDKP